MTDSHPLITDKQSHNNDSNSDYLSVADYDYELPDDLIARYPLAQRSASKFCICPPKANKQACQKIIYLPRCHRY